MNQDNENLENTSTNIENTVQENNNIEIMDVNTEPVEIEQEAIKPTVSETIEPLKPEVSPNVEIEESSGNEIKVDNQLHDIPIPDEDSKKDFVIKSKKETVAEEVKLREKRIEEHIKQANENYKPNSKATNFFLIIFLIFIIVFTVFLPQIHNFVSRLQNGDFNKQEEVKIINGTLKCTYENSSSTLDYVYEYNFKFKKNLLISYDRSTTTKGDAALDEDSLNKLKDNCKIMKNESLNIDGIEVMCGIESNSVKTTEVFELKNIKTDSLTPAYIEAGGEMPEYDVERNMDDLEKNMKAAGFTCKRVAS